MFLISVVLMIVRFLSQSMHVKNTKIHFTLLKFFLIKEKFPNYRLSVKPFDFNVTQLSGAATWSQAYRINLTLQVNINLDSFHFLPVSTLSICTVTSQILRSIYYNISKTTFLTLLIWKFSRKMGALDLLPCRGHFWPGVRRGFFTL